MNDFAANKCSCDEPRPSPDGVWCDACGRLIVTAREAVIRDDLTPPDGSRNVTRFGAHALERHCDVVVSRLTNGVYDPETPARMAKALGDLTSGYAITDFKALLKTFPLVDATADHGIVIVRGIPFASVCEHHVLPFVGKVDVAYVPTSVIVGVSKIPRLVRAISRRLQVQERIGVMIADTMMEHLAAKGVMVVIRAQHTCMAIRGAECPAEMVTSTVRGCFDKEPAARAEALELFRS